MKYCMKISWEFQKKISIRRISHKHHKLKYMNCLLSIMCLCQYSYDDFPLTVVHINCDWQCLCVYLPMRWGYESWDIFRFSLRAFAIIQQFYTWFYLLTVYTITVAIHVGLSWYHVRELLCVVNLYCVCDLCLGKSVLVVLLTPTETLLRQHFASEIINLSNPCNSCKQCITHSHCVTVTHCECDCEWQTVTECGHRQYTRIM